MSSIEEKYGRFAQLALKDAAAKRDNLLNQLNEYKTQKLKEAESECLENAYKVVRRGVSAAKKNAADIIAREPMKYKQSLYVYREKLVDEVFEELLKRINEFKKASEYEDFLLESVSDTLANSGEGTKTVIIDVTDSKFSDKIAKKFTCNVICRENIVGGCIVENSDTKIICNDSINDKIKELRGSFLEDSKFSIY